MVVGLLGTLVSPVLFSDLGQVSSLLSFLLPILSEKLDDGSQVGLGLEVALVKQLV